MQMSGGSVDNRNSAIAAGRNLSINGRGSSNSEDPNDWAGVVNNEALAGYKVVQRTSTIDYTYRPCPSRCDFEIYGGSRALGTSTVTKQVTLAGGNASITAGRKVQIEAREVNNAVVTAHSGGTPLDVAGWQGNNAYAPELGQQQGAGVVGGNAGAPGAQQGVAPGLPARRRRVRARPVIPAPRALAVSPRCRRRRWWAARRIRCRACRCPVVACTRSIRATSAGWWNRSALRQLRAVDRLGLHVPAPEPGPRQAAASDG